MHPSVGSAAIRGVHNALATRMFENTPSYASKSNLIADQWPLLCLIPAIQDDDKCDRYGYEFGIHAMNAKGPSGISRGLA